jgi:hypothetical protein
MMKRKKSECKKRTDPRGITRKERRQNEGVIDFPSDSAVDGFVLILCSDWIVGCNPVPHGTENRPLLRDFFQLATSLRLTRLRLDLVIA